LGLRVGAALSPKPYTLGLEHTPREHAARVRVGVGAGSLYTRTWYCKTRWSSAPRCPPPALGPGPTTAEEAEEAEEAGEAGEVRSDSRAAAGSSATLDALSAAASVTASGGPPGG